MDRTITNSQEAFEAACAERGYDPGKLIPDVSAMPEWLGRYVVSSIKRLIIAEAINGGRKRQPGKEYVYFPIWDLTYNSSGFGFSATDYAYWRTDTPVGARLEFFCFEDSDFFGSNFMDLHADVLLYELKLQKAVNDEN